MPVAKDGTIPFARWVVRKKGVVELGSMSCATCHTRIIEDGKVKYQAHRETIPMIVRAPGFCGSQVRFSARKKC